MHEFRRRSAIRPLQVGIVVHAVLKGKRMGGNGVSKKEIYYKNGKSIRGAAGA